MIIDIIIVMLSIIAIEARCFDHFEVFFVFLLIETKNIEVLVKKLVLDRIVKCNQAVVA